MPQAGEPMRGALPGPAVTPTTTEEEARLARGLCPHPHHGPAAVGQTGAYCDICDGYWSWDPGGEPLWHDWLLFRVVKDGRWAQSALSGDLLRDAAMSGVSRAALVEGFADGVRGHWESLPDERPAVRVEGEWVSGG